MSPRGVPASLHPDGHRVPGTARSGVTGPQLPAGMKRGKGASSGPTAHGCADWTCEGRASSSAVRLQRCAPARAVRTRADFDASTSTCGRPARRIELTITAGPPWRRHRRATGVNLAPPALASSPGRSPPAGSATPGARHTRRGHPPKKAMNRVLSPRALDVDDPVPQVRNRFAVTEPDLFTLRGHSLGQLTPPDPCLDSVHTTEVGGGRSTRSSPSTQGSRGTASP